MSRHLCVVQDFLTVPHRMRIRESAAAADLIPHFFTSAEADAAKDCLKTAQVLYAQGLILADLPIEDAAAYTELVCGLF